MTDLSIGSKYRFSIYPATMFSGRDFESVTIEAKMSASMARKLGYDVDALYAQSYNDLPENTPASPDSTSYYLIRGGSSGNSSVIADAWINPSTVQLVTGVTIEVVVTDVDSSYVNIVRDALTANGVRSFTINTR